MTLWVLLSSVAAERVRSVYKNKRVVRKALGICGTWAAAWALLFDSKAGRLFDFFNARMGSSLCDLQLPSCVDAKLPCGMAARLEPRHVVSCVSIATLVLLHVGKRGI